MMPKLDFICEIDSLGALDVFCFVALRSPHHAINLNLVAVVLLPPQLYYI